MIFTHINSGTQRLWVLNTPSLIMNRTFTYSNFSYYNPYSIYEITSTTLLTLFIGSNTSRINLGGVNISNQQPSTFINFILDSPQITVVATDPSFAIITGNSYVAILASPQTYSAYPNPITTSPFT